jgi:hypothetical protein
MTIEDYDDLIETLDSLSDYYSGVVGRSITLGLDSSSDVWIECNRIYEREYFDSVQEAERRLELLYSDYFDDGTDSGDPLEGL